MGNGYTNILLVCQSQMGKLNAAFVKYSPYGGYVWAGDVNVQTLHLNNYPFLLQYLHHSFDNLELKYFRDGLISAEIVSLEREGGYKEMFNRVVKYSFHGYHCLYRLENELCMHFHPELKSEDGFFARKKLFENVIGK